MNYKKILIAVDNGPTAETVAAAGFELGKQLGAEIALLSVVDTTFLITEGGLTPKEMADLLRKDFRENEKMLIEKVFKQHKVWTFTEEGKPYESILETAREWNADLVVVGTHGRKGLSHLLLGSVSEQVVRHAAVPVFVVPAH